MRRLLHAVTAFGLVVVVTPITSVAVVLAALLFLPLPAKVPERTPPAPSQVSRIVDAAGNEIATLKQFETSIPVRPEDIPEVLKQAVIAAEDRSFYEHGGVDVRGTLRALWSDLRSGTPAQGGSTITQQLVKNTVTGNERTIGRKVREAVLASQLDRKLGKDEILFEYLSIIYFGEGAYGVGAAAETYFRKPVSQLTLSESALLASLIPAPSRYSPRADRDLAEQRRVHVLGTMLDEGMIDRAAHDAAVAEPVWLASFGTPPGPATVVQPAQVPESSQPYFRDYVVDWLERHLPGGRDLLYRGGLRIETTLDPRQQAAAQARVAELLEGTHPDLQTSLVAVEPPTGYVRAFVSGRDYATRQVNYALGAAGGGAGRQAGSSFKPFVLAEALSQGVGPDTVYSGAPHTVNGKQIENFGGARYGNLPLREATRRSVNTVYTRLILDIGVDKVMALAKRMGLTSVRDYDPSVHSAAVALGTESVAPLDMASAYGVFAARGLRAEPTPVLRVLDRDGKVLVDNTAPTTERVLGEAVADNATDILRGVLVSGTAAGRGIDRPAAGKTGTAQNSRDAWFVGYTPTLSTAVWMGYDPPGGGVPAPLTNIKGVRAVTGGSHPARLWQAFMREALAGVPVTEFNQPAPITPVADLVKRIARGGFAPAPPMAPSKLSGGGPLEQAAAPPPVSAPSATTTTTTEPTTTTTVRRGGGVLGIN